MFGGEQRLQIVGRRLDRVCGGNCKQQTRQAFMCASGLRGDCELSANASSQAANVSE